MIALEKLAERFPTVPAYQYDLAKTYLQASLHFETGELATAANQLNEALRVTQKLVADEGRVFPDKAAWQDRCA